MMFGIPGFELVVDEKEKIYLESETFCTWKDCLSGSLRSVKILSVLKMFIPCRFMRTQFAKPFTLLRISQYTVSCCTFFDVPEATFCLNWLFTRMRTQLL
jgi:hypothetical protein